MMHRLLRMIQTNLYQAIYHHVDTVTSQHAPRVHDNVKCASITSVHSAQRLIMIVVSRNVSCVLIVIREIIMRVGIAVICRLVERFDSLFGYNHKK